MGERGVAAQGTPGQFQHPQGHMPLKKFNRIQYIDKFVSIYTSISILLLSVFLFRFSLFICLSISVSISIPVSVYVFIYASVPSFILFFYVFNPVTSVPISDFICLYPISILVCISDILLSVYLCRSHAHARTREILAYILLPFPPLGNIFTRHSLHKTYSIKNQKSFIIFLSSQLGRAQHWVPSCTSCS